MAAQTRSFPSAGRVLVIRKDNIGDLVLTTPLLLSLAEHFGNANLDLLTNRYAGAALKHGLPVSRIYLYDKAKHERSLFAKLSSWTSRLWMLLSLRRQRYDVVILVDDADKRKNQSLIRLIRPRKLVAFSKTTGEKPDAICVPLARPEADEHEIDRTLRLLAPLKVPITTRQPSIEPEPSLVRRWREALPCGGQMDRKPNAPIIHIHLSARRPKQRWPLSHYADLIRRLGQLSPTPIILCTWAPGSKENLRFPGDDDSAQTLKSLIPDSAEVCFCDARELPDLIAVISLAEVGFGPDGGVTHLTVGLGKPAVTMFGDMSPSQWAPVSVGSVTLASQTGFVSDITVQQAFQAIKECLEARSVH